jgi:hypothetical protein
LVAHEDDEIVERLTERVEKLKADVFVCHNSAQIGQYFASRQTCVLLLDVAFDGSFPFQLIETIKGSGNDQHKVVLLPSVYNRTAYKKRPDSLYGADAYLELHHIGDMLIPTLAELYPVLATQVKNISAVPTSAEERSLSADDIIAQADRLAKLLVADILLYHEDKLEQGLESDSLDQLFAGQLAEGRRLLIERLPEAAELPVDFIQQAFDAACQSYSCS